MRLRIIRCPMFILVVVLMSVLLGSTVQACGLGGFLSTEVGAEDFTLMSYNVQAMFDPEDNGHEYPDFRLSAGTWSEPLYRQRLDQLCRVITAELEDGPDILVLVEIENARVLGDFADTLGGYEHMICPPSGESALCCGVLSRFPVLAARAHRQGDSLPEAYGGPIGEPLAPGNPAPSLSEDARQSRFLLEVELEVKGQPLLLLATHWKSKLGGDRETEGLRRAAALLASRILRQRLVERPDLPYILAGDLNENPDEWERAGRLYPTALMPCTSGPGPWLLVCACSPQVCDSAIGTLVLYNPWGDSGDYSYLYAGKPEQIDHLLLSRSLVGDGPVRLLDFGVVRPDFCVSTAGSPLGWRVGRGDSEGAYSDHLPIYAKFSCGIRN